MPSKEKVVNNLDLIAEHVRRSLSTRDEAREKMLPMCRESIRNSSNAIRAVHRREFDDARELIKTAGKVLRQAETVVSAQTELSNTGMLRDAQKEFTEANVVLALVSGYLLPTLDELEVDVAAYLNGLGEAMGELRRFLLDSMRRGDLDRGEEILGAMDNVYGLLVTLDYPDAITGGLRRTTDMVRGVLERTRSDLTLTIRQMELEKKLYDFNSDSAVKESSTSKLSEAADEKNLELEMTEQELYNELEAWRSIRSSEENVPPYIIARNSWLKEIIKVRPSSPRDLMAIKGFGERRANKYGKDIIRVITRGR
jgi:translin